ncbi:MAG: hypothetical protein WCK35_05275 [Chloroflexota bacterium]
MKITRLISIMLVLVMSFSIWTPAPVYARSAQAATASLVEKAKITVVKLNINNKTSGYLYINLVGEGRNYYFAATNKGKNTFEIAPGKYTYTISASACKGSVTKTKNFKSKSASLGSWICRK